MENLILFLQSDTLKPFLQILLAMVLGVLLGMQRTLAGKTAGMRTYSLVSMGACLLTLISVVVTERFSPITKVDPLSLISGIITGIGFIGAGLIIFKETKINGLTTAAGIWITAGIGIAVGYGLFLIAIFTTILTFIDFSFMWYLENGFKKIYKYDIKQQDENGDGDIN